MYKSRIVQKSKRYNQETLQTEADIKNLASSDKN